MGEEPLNEHTSHANGKDSSGILPYQGVMVVSYCCAANYRWAVRVIECSHCKEIIQHEAVVLTPTPVLSVCNE